MANSALHRPDMPGPQPAETTKLTAVPPVVGTVAPHLRANGETGDKIFKFLMLLCGLAVLGVLALIVYELMLRSSLSWHAFGFKFFKGPIKS